KDIPVADEAELINTAKLNMLKVRDGESFDIAYARNQITTHEEAIALFQKAVFLNDRELSRFAEKNLPVLQEHLALAEQLLATVTPADMELPPRRTFESPADKPVETERPALQPAPREINPGVHNPSEQPAATVARRGCVTMPRRAASLRTAPFLALGAAARLTLPCSPEDAPQPSPTNHSPPSADPATKHRPPPST